MFAFDKWSGGGTLAGAVGGFLVAGPVGAVLGGVAGHYAGEKLKPAAKCTTTLALIGGSQAISVAKGGSICVQAPAGGEVVSLAPAQGSHIGALHVANKTGTIAGTASGDVNALWRDPSGNAQSSVISVTVLGA